MMRKTYVKDSVTVQDGLGLFARENIPEGAVWWKEELNKNSLRLSYEQYRTLHKSEIRQSELSSEMFNAIATYSYFCEERDCLILTLDNARFTNHSSSPNSKMVKVRNEDGTIHWCSVALRDILTGEEICEDYREYNTYQWPEPWDEFSELNQHVNQELRQKYLEKCTKATVPTTKIFDGIPVLDILTYVAPGEYGLGLFASEDVPYPHTVWSNDETTVLPFSQAAWETFSQSEMERSPLSRFLLDGVRTYAFYDSRTDSLLLCLDNWRFVNHFPSKAVIGEGPKGTSVLLRDLKKGEEILDNYGEYPRCPWAHLDWPFVEGYEKDQVTSASGATR